ncbi:hypothetical protein Poli38472_012686 [Pythium oligandrum]|uniref:Uncharacterized protein n=1 Tax=Pythium oligandrum TaxID=41045 RepID=A0A8K1CE32_PYTOL|nr:hypothetical protein Poli38472_012686 [Pythium oligandrum]|eukprot:TMW61495.1 hypothetical protein Poli38472_012686 [Pythium oligandrum]
MAWPSEDDAAALLDAALYITGENDGAAFLMEDTAFTRDLAYTFASDRDVFSLLHVEGLEEPEETAIETNAQGTSVEENHGAVEDIGGTQDEDVIKKEVIEPPAQTASTKKRRTNRKREELIFLRSTVDELEGRLLKLKERQLRYEGTEDGDDSERNERKQSQMMTTVWENIANRQFEQRRQAEAENTRLRVMLEEQIRVAKTLERVMRKRSRSIDLLPPQESDKTKCVRSWNVLDDDSVFDTLINNLVVMYAEVDLILADRRLRSPPPFRDISLRNDVTLGTAVETCDCCILPFDFERTAAAVWRQYHKKSSPETGHDIHLQRAERAENTVTSEFEGNMRTLQSEYRGKIAVRRFVEASRVVIVWEVLVELLRIAGSPLDGVIMRHKKWEIIQPAPYQYTTNSPATLVRAYQLATPEILPIHEHADPSVTRSEHEKKAGMLTSFVLRSMELQLDTNHVAVENILLEGS